MQTPQDDSNYKILQNCASADRSVEAPSRCGCFNNGCEALRRCADAPAPQPLPNLLYCLYI